MLQFHIEGKGDFVFGGQSEHKRRTIAERLPAPSSELCTEMPTRMGLIEDAENNDNQILVRDGRSGYLYTYVDTEGSTISPGSSVTGELFSASAGGVHGSQFALRIRGEIAAAKIVFAGMGMNLTDPKGHYDVSRYDGIAFWAKAGPGSMRTVKVKLPDGNTDPDGGVCSACFNDFGVVIELTEQWTRYQILFRQLRQEPGWGAPRAPHIDTSKVYGIQFHTPGSARGAFDYWVDDVMFVDCL